MDIAFNGSLLGLDVAWHANDMLARSKLAAMSSGLHRIVVCIVGLSLMSMNNDLNDWAGQKGYFEGFIFKQKFA